MSFELASSFPSLLLGVTFRANAETAESLVATFVLLWECALRVRHSDFGGRSAADASSAPRTVQFGWR